MGSVRRDVLKAYLRELAPLAVAPPVAYSHPDEATARPLSARERQVLAHFAQGSSTKGVARILGISPRTIDTYSAVIMQKLRARNRIHAIAIAFGTGILTKQDEPPLHAGPGNAPAARMAELSLRQPSR